MGGWAKKTIPCGRGRKERLNSEIWEKWGCDMWEKWVRWAKNKIPAHGANSSVLRRGRHRRGASGARRRRGRRVGRVLRPRSDSHPSAAPEPTRAQPSRERARAASHRTRRARARAILRWERRSSSWRRRWVGTVRVRSSARRRSSAGPGRQRPGATACSRTVLSLPGIAGALSTGRRRRRSRRRGRCRGGRRT